MSQIMCQDLKDFVPSSEFDNVVCYVLYDWHPRDEKKLNIAICTQNGEVKEFYRKVLISSISIDGEVYFENIRILRNYEGELFYLAQAHDELIILSRNSDLSIVRRFKSVTSFDLIDSKCTGRMELRLIRRFSGLGSDIEISEYLSVDDVLTMEVEATDTRKVDYNTPILSDLKTKLNEAEYIRQCNENAYRQILKLRQQVTALSHTSEDNIAPDKILNPIVRFCDKKIVILIEMENPYTEPIENVHTLIHNNFCNSISYTTKVFKHLAMSPFYEEMETHEVECNSKGWVVAVIPINEFKILSSVSSRIDFNVVVSYRRRGKGYLQSFGNVNISVCDVMGNNFDVFNTAEINENTMVLAMLATTEKQTLYLKHISLDAPVELLKVICDHLQMELLSASSNIAIHKRSPHHILHGLMLILYSTVGDFKRSKFDFRIDVYARCQFQVRALIHLLATIPHRVVVVTPNIRVTPKDACKGNLYWNYYYDLQRLDYSRCSDSLFRQLSLTLEYLQDCKQTNPRDTNINIFANGFDKYSEYRNMMLAEFDSCVKTLAASSTEKIESEAMDVE